MPAGSKPGERRGGRKKGTPNKLTTEAREAFRMVYEQRLGDLERWLRETGDGYEQQHVTKEGEVVTVVIRDPGKAAALLLSMAEHFVPKLQRHEVSGHDGKAIIFRIEEPTK